MKVAINSPSLDVNINISGVSSLVNEIIAHNAQASYIHLIYGKADSEKGVFLKRFWEIAGANLLLLKLLYKNAFDLVHFNLVLYPKSIYRDVITYAICRVFKKSIIIHLHGGTYLLRKPQDALTLKLIKYMLKSAAVVIALSSAEKDAVENLYGITGVKILPNAVDTVQFAFEARKKRGKTKFLFLGRLHQSKGLELLIPAFEKLYQKGYPVELIICGDGHLKAYVVAKARENAGIQYRAVVSGKERLEVMRECDVFLLPSLYGEGLPLALLETMSCGLVPIVTGDGSMKSVIQNRVNGLLVKTNDPGDLAAAMELALTDETLMSEIAAAASRTVGDHYNWPGYIDSLNKLYAGVLPGKQ